MRGDIRRSEKEIKLLINDVEKSGLVIDAKCSLLFDDSFVS